MEKKECQFTVLFSLILLPTPRDNSCAQVQLFNREYTTERPACLRSVLSWLSPAKVMVIGTQPPIILLIGSKEAQDFAGNFEA